MICKYCTFQYGFNLHALGLYDTKTITEMLVEVRSSASHLEKETIIFPDDVLLVMTQQAADAARKKENRQKEQEKKKVDEENKKRAEEDRRRQLQEAQSQRNENLKDRKAKATARKKATEVENTAEVEVNSAAEDTNIAEVAASPELNADEQPPLVPPFGEGTVDSFASMNDCENSPIRAVFVLSEDVSSLKFRRVIEYVCKVDEPETAIIVVSALCFKDVKHTQILDFHFDFFLVYGKYFENGRCGANSRNGWLCVCNDLHWVVAICLSMFGFKILILIYFLL